MSVASKPNRIEIYIKLARTHEKLREIEEAILNYNKCLRRDKQNFTALQKLGLAYIRNNQRYEGVLYLQKALAISPNDLETLVSLGEIFSREDDNLAIAEKHLL